MQRIRDVRVRGAHELERTFLAAGWRTATCAPGAVKTPPELEAAGLDWIEATVPSTIASTLASSGAFGLNGSPRRFDAEDVWYRIEFPGAPARADERVSLHFDGLATVADVWLNGELVLSSRSMFVAHQIDVGSRLARDNQLSIVFRALDSVLAARKPRPRWRTPMVEHQQLRWVRATLLGRTPGWSPPCAAVGPYREVRLERRRAVDVSRVELSPRLVGGAGAIDVSMRIEGLGEARVERAIVMVTGPTGSHRASLEPAAEDGIYAGTIIVERPSLWWPHTHGDAALYAVSATVSSSAGETEMDLGSTGFRDLSVNRDGGRFAIEVNGVRTFCRGACWMPLDPVALKSDREAVDAAVAQVHDAGMNMLRVSGTTVYEDDAFFDACDARGVLVWQDLMFANMDYPEEESFVDLARHETKSVLERLRARPSLAIVCGNSEGEQQAAMWGAARDLWSPGLFHRVLADVATSACPHAVYWPSSAHGGSFPHQNDVGTTSYYGVGAYLRPLEDARRAEVKFASECLAFSNVPEPATILRMPGGDGIRSHHPVWKTRAPRDLGAGWDFEDVRDHYLSSLFGVDPIELRARDHDRYLHLSRIVTGEVMAATFSEWRRGRSVCGGGLVWFLRDLWPGAGWGVVDSLGAPKAAYFYLRRALRPLHLGLSDEATNGLFIHVVNDAPTGVEGEVELTLVRGGEVIVARGSQTVEVAPRASIEVPAALFFEGLYDTAYAYRFGPPTHDLVTARLVPKEGPVAEAFFFPVGFPRAVEEDVGLEVEGHPVGDGSFRLRVRSRKFAQSVWVDAEGFAPDDNYFHVAPGAERSIHLARRQSKIGRCALAPANCRAISKVTLKD